MSDQRLWKFKAKDIYGRTSYLEENKRFIGSYWDASSHGRYLAAKYNDITKGLIVQVSIEEQK